MMGVRLSAVCLAASCLWGCASGEERSFKGEAYMVAGEGTVLVEEVGGVVAAVSAIDGAVQWRYRPLLEHPSYLDLSPTFGLVCPVVETPAGDLLLRYDAELHVISRKDGQFRWKVDLYRLAERELRCPAAATDSGVLLLRRHGVLVQKLSHDGAPAWQYPLVGLGSAVSPPVVAADSGDVLVQTTSHLVNLSPNGSLNWARPRPEILSGEMSSGPAAPAAGLPPTE